MTIFNQDPAFNPADIVQWNGLHGAGKSLAIAEAAAQHKGLSVFVTGTAQEAAVQSRAIQFFLREKFTRVYVS